MTTVQDQTMPSQIQKVPLVMQFANRYSVDPGKLLETLRQTAFKQTDKGPEVTNEHMMAMLVVANEYQLNPFTREIFAFPNKLGGITPVVSVDGWLRITNTHPQFDGMEFSDLFNDDGKLCAITCRIYRRDRNHPTEVTEYLDECQRDTDIWKKYPARMLRHKATIQCARYAFGFAGIYDQDEAERILQTDQVEVTRTHQTKSSPYTMTQDSALVREVDQPKQPANH